MKYLSNLPRGTAGVEPNAVPTGSACAWIKLTPTRKLMMSAAVRRVTAMIAFNAR